ncbi:hypothetical protein E2C01_046065 [Portunus trituberculatus]|uniref:Uncharacterized protein n=1 Tax=Portunus trituberculatus TaxID=210409 RepID=A0A5B7FZY8_PORTR|nr:hypothetical protein [Portunus trituberculatus]
MTCGYQSVLLSYITPTSTLRLSPPPALPYRRCCRQRPQLPPRRRDLLLPRREENSSGRLPQRPQRAAGGTKREGGMMGRREDRGVLARCHFPLLRCQAPTPPTTLAHSYLTELSPDK